MKIKTALIKTLWIMLVYAILSIFINLNMHGDDWSWSTWLSPFNHIILLDLIPIEGFNMERTSINGYIDYYESEAREVACKIANTILIFTVHFLSFLPKRKWVRRTCITASFTIVIGWTIFIVWAMILASAG